MSFIQDGFLTCTVFFLAVILQHLVKRYITYLLINELGFLLVVVMKGSSSARHLPPVIGRCFHKLFHRRHASSSAFFCASDVTICPTLESNLCLANFYFGSRSADIIINIPSFCACFIFEVVLLLHAIDDNVWGQFFYVNSCKTCFFY